MGQELELDLNDKFFVVLSPDTVLPSHQYCLNEKKICKNGKPSGKDDFLKLKENFADIKFGRLLNSSWKSLPCRSHGLEGNVEMKRSSMYQSSEQVINIKKMGTMRGRKKIEISSRSSDASFSGSVVDSLYVWDEKYGAVKGFGSINTEIRNDKVAGSLTDESYCSPRSSPRVSFTSIRKKLNPFTNSKSVTSPVSCVLETTEVKLTGTRNGTRNRTYQRSLLNDFSNTRKHSEIISEFINRDIQFSGMKGETFRPDEESLTTKNKLPSGNTDFDNSNSYPLASTELHSNPEIAAVVLQIPFHKRESLKYKRRGGINAEAYSKLSELSSAVEQVKVVLPTGNHVLPGAESQGPSSLLDRWKHGGGCDCGGWDMACPLILLGNPSVQFTEDRPLMEECQTLELFTQGAKERTPTFGMTMVEEGQYAVDFHAQLCPLQAFSICVAILHGAGQEKKQQISRCNSLKMLLEEEVQLFINSVTKEENRTVPKIQKGINLPYVLNPPFSPIARV
uniref:Uncharacterized protein n=1 Tax=Cajanus cajan TaxID=3821 RepID=A0A151TJS6_CAJCA|nr:hypothetical protein KK1_013614 [Cajanus cajan]